MNRLTWFFGATRVGRWVAIHLHPLTHKGISHPLRFQVGGCWFCRLMTRVLVPQSLQDAMADQSRITISEPVYDEDGKLVKRGVFMSATVRRQMDEILAGPNGDSLREAIEEIQKDPEL